MTCIAVKIENKKISIAGDNQTSWGNNKMPKKAYSDNQVKGFGKIFQTNGMTLGCAGSVSHIGLLQVFCKTHKPKDMEKDSIMDWFIEFREWIKKKADVNYNDLCIHGIIISEGKVFAFYDFMDISEVTTFDAIGSGMWLAMGAMELGANVKQAVDVAVKYELFCGGEVNVIDILN